VIYFIQSGDDGPIKIGLASDVRERLRALQTAHHEKLTLLGVSSGDRKEERLLHIRFAQLRGIGEWFRPARELLDYIQQNTGVLADVLPPSHAFLAEVREGFYRIIRESGWTAKEMAKASGSTTRAAQMWLAGETLPHLPNYIALARQMPTLKAQTIKWMEPPAGDHDQNPNQVLAKIAQLVQGRAG
jgi:hypothetical protein